MDCTTKIKMTGSVLQLRFRDPEVNDLCEKFASIPKRVREVIKAEGGHINY